MASGGTGDKMAQVIRQVNFAFLCVCQSQRLTLRLSNRLQFTEKKISFEEINYSSSITPYILIY